MKKLAMILALALALCLTTSALAETVFQLGTTVNEQDHSRRQDLSLQEISFL